MKVLAGIVTYNPNIKRLEENIKAVSKQVATVIIFDNGSKNAREIKKIGSKYQQVKMIFSSRNNGIAFALNEIAKLAIQLSYTWLLTLDGDSVIYPGLIKEYEKNMHLPNVGQLTCKRKDRNIHSLIKTSNQLPRKVKYAITSASLINLKALKSCGGFDEKLFIDWVDNEICCALRKHGYETYEIDYIGLLQEMGHASLVHFFNKSFYRPNYSPIRYYYNARNSLYVSRLYPNEENSKSILLNQLKVLILNSLYEKNKKAKAKAIISGIHDGLRLSNRRERYIN